MHWHALSLNSCAHGLLIVYELLTKWHESATKNFVVTSRDTLEKILEHFKFLATTWHALFHLTRIPTHSHAHCHEFFPHWHAKLRATA